MNRIMCLLLMPLFAYISARSSLCHCHLLLAFISLLWLIVYYYILLALGIQLSIFVCHFSECTGAQQPKSESFVIFSALFCLFRIWFRKGTNFEISYICFPSSEKLCNLFMAHDTIMKIRFNIIQLGASVVVMPFIVMSTVCVSCVFCEHAITHVVEIH